MDKELLEHLKTHKELLTAEIINEIRKLPNGREEVIDILDLNRDNEEFYTDAYGKRVQFDGYRNIKKAHTKLELANIHLEEIKRCMEDLDYFRFNYVKIRTKSGIGFPEIREYQRRFLDVIQSDAESVVVSFPRQSGKSATTAIYLAWLFCFKPAINIGICANRASTAIDFLTNVKGIFMSLPIWMKPGITVWNGGSICNERGTTIITDATNENTFRGRAVHVLVVDECIGYDSQITVKHKATGDVYTTSIGEFYDQLCESDDNEAILNDCFLVKTSDGFQQFSGIKRSEHDHFLRIVFNDSAINVTSDHKFYHFGRFIYANDIHKGDNINGKTVEDIQVINKTAYFFDLLEVENGHHYTANGIEVSNCAFIPNFKIFSDSVLPSQSSLAWKKTILISTPNGMNHFYELVRDAKARKVLEHIGKDEIPDNVLETVENPDGTFSAVLDESANGYTFVDVDWKEVPRYNGKGELIEPERFKDDIVAKYGLQYFRQNYQCEFIGSSATLINGDVIAAIEPERGHDRLIAGKHLVHVYREPEQGHKYIFAVDPAKNGGDYFAMQMVDITKFPFIQVLTANLRVDYLEMPGYIFTLAEEYNGALVIIENNEGAGQSIADTLYRDFEYGNLYYDRSGDKLKKYPGYRTTPKSRTQMLNTLKMLMENGKLIVLDAETKYELERFVLVGNKYQAVAGYHDDLVMALAIALCLFNNIDNFTDIRVVADSVHSTEDSQCFTDLITIGDFDDGIEEMPESAQDEYYIWGNLKF